MAVKWKKDSVKAMREQREAATKAEAMNAQAQIAVMAFCATATTITDAQALQMPDLFPVWEDVLAAGEKLAEGTILKDRGSPLSSGAGRGRHAPGAPAAPR